VSTELEQDYNDLLTRLHGSRAFGIDENFTQPEREMNNRFFFSRAASIYSGSNEIQRNIIAKRVLGLPD
jgi:alkylation response protein AidB-like acyl-CoA dehydrogenase